MEAPTVATVRSRFAEFASRTDTEIQQAAASALAISAVSEEATLHLTAHLLALSGEQTGEADGGAGEVNSEATGSRSVSYAPMAETGVMTWWTTTPYGRIAWMLQAASPAFAVSLRSV